ncbi:MAG: serine/threonine protein kinase [Myxococcales bacterium]|nr:serine/threonine protein kinase [Myxococcales bacterium]MCB9643653.1 serine/threonine protein kinase [Myxococcales bacterium]
MTTLKHEEKTNRPVHVVAGGYGLPRQEVAQGEKDWSEDALVVGNYQLMRLVGQGGFGAVYEAQHVTLKNPFAVKLLQPKWAKEEKFFERFQREALVMAELRHENVVQVIDFGVSEELGPYLICEWLEGKSLYRLWRLNRNLKWGWVLALMLQLLDALEYAHERGIVHRDLKPENIIMTMGSRGRMLVKIVDFGIAHMVGRHFEHRDEKKDELQQHGAAIGTPFYMCPEQVRGELHRIDHRADLYACGVILAELLTGARVFDGGSNRDTMRLQLEALPPRLSEINPDREYPEILEVIVAKALSKDPADRFQNAREFNQTLEQAMRSVGIDPIWEDIYHDSGEATGLFPMPKRHVIEYKMISPAVPPARPLRSVAMGVFVAVLLLAVGVGAFRFMNPPPPPKKPLKRVAQWGPDPVRTPPPLSMEAKPLALVDDKKAGSPAKEEKSTEPETRGEPEERVRPRKNKRRRGRWRRRKTRRTKRRGGGAVEKAPVERTTPPVGREAGPEKTNPVQPKATRLSYRIQTTPAGADVFVDGQKIGVTPLTIRREVGKRVQIEIKKAGYVSRAYLFTFKKNTKSSFRLIEELL